MEDLNSELPDELGNPLVPSSDSAQNGTKVETAVHPENTTQKHQQLSQLLSSTALSTASPQQNQVHPGPSNSPNIAGGLAAGLGNLNNAVKSPLSNSLASPGNVVNKGPHTSLPHSLSNDLLTSSAYSNIASSSTVTSSPMVGAMSMANSLNKPMTSQALINSGNVNMHQTQLMNGPQMRMNTAVTTLSSLPGTLGNSTMANTLAAGQLQNPQGLNHPGLNSQNILQVSCFKVLLTSTVANVKLSEAAQNRHVSFPPIYTRTSNIASSVLFQDVQKYIQVCLKFK